MLNSLQSVSDHSWPSQLTPPQPSIISRTDDEYQPKCGDALRQGSKGQYGSFYL